MFLPSKIGWIASFVLTVFAGDRLVGFVLNKMYFSQHSGDRFAITYALDSTKADLLILGNSRATHHYVSTVFEDSLNLTCFNTGKDGEGISFNYALLSGIVKRYIPGYVILDFNSESLYKKRTAADDLSTLLPYYASNSAIRALIIRERKFERIKQLSAIYPFNSTLLSSAMGIWAALADPALKGYIPLKGKINSPNHLSTSDFINQEIDTLKLRDFSKFISCCRENKIKLIVVQSPRFAIQKNDRIKTIADSLLREEKIPFFDYKSDTNFLNHPSYFKDASHLNMEGAALFSIKLSKAVAGEMKNNSIHSF